MTKKKCYKCGGLKPVESFYKHPQMGDGRLSKCKTCTKKDVSANYRTNREHYKKYEKERFKRPERRKKALEYQKKRREKSPGKYRALTAVSNAVRDGRLIKLACQACGNMKAEAHHKDYRKPLDVMWLCRKHHLMEHDKEAF